jgi:hypothetical protein
VTEAVARAEQAAAAAPGGAREQALVFRDHRISIAVVPGDPARRP